MELKAITTFSGRSLDDGKPFSLKKFKADRHFLKKSFPFISKKINRKNDILCDSNFLAPRDYRAAVVEAVRIASAMGEDFSASTLEVLSANSKVIPCI